MVQNLAVQVQKPTEFKYVTKHLGKTAYLSDLVRTAGTNQTFESEYFDVNLALQNLITSDPSLTIPLDSHIYEMVKAGKDAQHEGTGSILLIPGDKGLVNPSIEPRIKIQHPTWTHYGVSHKLEGSPQNPKIKILDETELVETNIPLNLSKIVYPKRIENGTLMEVQDKPNPNCPQEIIWLDSRYKKKYDIQLYDSGVCPLRRGSLLDHRESVPYWSLCRGPSYSVWRSRLCSVESQTADRKQILEEKILSKF